MTTEAQIKALAELDGWQLWRHDKTETYLFEPPNITASILNGLHMLWVKVNKWPEASVFVDMQHVPNYLNDLNAIHELEKKLTEEVWKYYPYRLMQVTKNFYVSGRLLLLHATASQRCEAILRATGRWVE